MPVILAGDVGGTTTRLGLFVAEARRPTALRVKSYRTTEYDGLPTIVGQFLGEGPPAAIVAAVFGVAGPVVGRSVQMTNVRWRVHADELSVVVPGAIVALLNDLEAMAWAVPLLTPDERRTLQAGTTRPGNIALLAAGTGLGGALLHWRDGQYTAIPSELGHSDFAARTERELAFVRYARERFGRVDIERVVSGPGLVALAEFSHSNPRCEALTGQPAHSAAPRISTAALARSCPGCVTALEMFAEALGAVAGNLALMTVALGGVFIGGGIPMKILPALEDSRFTAAFLDKAPMRGLLESMPVHVILNEHAGLLGAAAHALALVDPAAER